jgi:hypothetical protein
MNIGPGQGFPDLERQANLTIHLRLLGLFSHSSFIQMYVEQVLELSYTRNRKRQIE